jgi:hypothetical protein
MGLLLLTCSLLSMSTTASIPCLAAQIDPRSMTPDNAGGKTGLSGAVFCKQFFAHVSIETLYEHFTNAALYEREDALGDCVEKLPAPKTIEQSATYIEKTQELYNVRAVVMARLLLFIQQKQLTQEWLDAPAP